MGFSTVPIPSTSQRTRSPGSRKTGGSRKTPTPDGVPVAITSPGSSVMTVLMWAMRASDREDHVGRRAVLHRHRGALVRPAGARDQEGPQAHAGDGVELVGGDEDRAHRQERVGALGPQPLAVALLALTERLEVALPVAGTDVVDDQVARDMRHRLRDRDSMGLPADHDGELDFQVERVRALWPHDRHAVADDGVRRTSRTAADDPERPARPRPHGLGS